MYPGFPVLKKASYVALAALGVLFILGIVFYKERIFFADASFILYSIIDTKRFYIQEHRYGSFITQLIPYLGQKLHMPISTLIFGYAISFNLFYLSVASLLVFKFRQYGLAVLMSLYYFMFVSASFFWTNNEIHQAVAWMFLLLGSAIYMGNAKTASALLFTSFFILAFFTIFSHFVVIIPLTFLWVYLILERKNWPFSNIRTITLSILLVLVVVLKFYVANHSDQSYDTMHLKGLTSLSLSDIISSVSANEVKLFLIRCLSNYWICIVVLIAGITALIKSKLPLLATWVLLSTLGYLIIMGLIYSDPNSNILLFHIESEWASLAVIIGAAFVFSSLPRQNPLIASCFLAGIFIIRLVYILVASQPFSLRIRTNEHILDQMQKKGITKLGLINEQKLMDENLLYWALANESLLMSAMRHEQPMGTFFLINADDQSTRENILHSKGYYNAYFVIPPDQLNLDYYKIDTSRHYQIMTYQDLMR